MPETPHERRFDSRSEYQHAIGAVLASARREICVFDPDLRGVDFNTRDRSEAIAAFLSGGRDRSLRIVLHEVDHVSRECPRVMSLLKRFSHCFSIRQTPDSLRQLADCFILAADASVVIRFHADHSRGKLLLSAPEASNGWRQRFEDLWLESIPAVSATHLGL